MKLCSVCGTAYEDHATYCNTCRRESLVTIDAPPDANPAPEPIRNDSIALAAIAGVWLIALGWMLGVRVPRSYLDLFVGWALVTLVTAVIGLVLRNGRTFVVFCGIGFLFLAIYALVKL